MGDIINPTSVVLLQELERFNKLIKRMDVSLNNLQKVMILSITEHLYSLIQMCGVSAGSGW